MNPILTQCPVCHEPMEVTCLYCSHCDTTVEGHFSGTSNPFAALTAEQMSFVLTFVRCEGRLNRMEVEMGMSYPTIRNRLFEVIRALGYEPGKDETPIRLTPEDRKRILDDLYDGKITSEQATHMLQGEG